MDRKEFLLALRTIKNRYEKGESTELVFPGEEAGQEYKRLFQKPTRLIILGCGYVAQALCRFASALEFYVVVTDDRPSFANHGLFPDADEVICDSFENAIDKIKIRETDFVVVVTRGHRHDVLCLRALLDKKKPMPAYVGQIGSKRRVIQLMDALEKEGYERERLDQVYTPIGLSIGAVTPEEIGISILAELIKVRSEKNNRTKDMLDQTNADPVFLEYVENNEEKVIALVVGRSGSAPVKTGAIMAIDRLGKSYGTVGGGCGEHEVTMQARNVFLKKQDRSMLLDLTNDVASDEGMVCGGTMKIMLYYMPGE